VRILTNLKKNLFEYIQSRSLSSCNTFKTFGFSTFYTTIPHSKLKDRLKNESCFSQKRMANIVLGREKSDFVKKKIIITIILWCNQKLFWNWYHQNAGVRDWQHIYYGWWTCFSTDNMYSLVPLFVRCRLHTGVSQGKRKEASPIL
jgi:hypothetical protein